jgi:hypothetical protein
MGAKIRQGNEGRVSARLDFSHLRGFSEGAGEADIERGGSLGGGISNIERRIPNAE